MSTFFDNMMRARKASASVTHRIDMLIQRIGKSVPPLAEEVDGPLDDIKAAIDTLANEIATVRSN